LLLLRVARLLFGQIAEQVQLTALVVAEAVEDVLQLFRVLVAVAVVMVPVAVVDTRRKALEPKVLSYSLTLLPPAMLM
jgi:hypothetical protein